VLGLRLALPAALLFAVCALTTPAASAAVERTSASPPIGAYQEPAPRAPDEKHARDFVNELLEQGGTTKRVTTRELRGGVVLAPPAAKPPPPPPSPRPSSEEREPTKQLPPPDTGPAERAGVGTPVDQDVPGVLLGLGAAVILAAVGVTLELSDRRRRRRDA
jgi:hypothetical protein